MSEIKDMNKVILRGTVDSIIQTRSTMEIKILTTVDGHRNMPTVHLNPSSKVNLAVGDHVTIEGSFRAVRDRETRKFVLNVYAEKIGPSPLIDDEVTGMSGYLEDCNVFMLEGNLSHLYTPGNGELTIANVNTTDDRGRMTIIGVTCFRNEHRMVIKMNDGDRIRIRGTVQTSQNRDNQGRVYETPVATKIRPVKNQDAAPQEEMQETVQENLPEDMPTEYGEYDG